MLAITDDGTEEVSDDEVEPMRLADLNGVTLTWQTADGETRRTEFDE